MPKYVTSRPESEIVISGITPELTTADGDCVYLSLRGWCNKGIIDRITISANTDAVDGPMDIKLLSDPAKYSTTAAPDDEDYVLAAWNNEDGSAGPNTTWKLDERYIDGIYVEDKTLSGMLHLLLIAQDVGGVTLSDASTYDVKIYGRPSFDMENYFNRQHIHNEVYWRNDQSTDAWTDFTELSKNVTDARSSRHLFNMVTATTAAGQYYYVGADSKFTRVFFDVADINETQVALTAEYWDGSTWKSLSIFDCTNSLINGLDYTLGHPGLVYWAVPNDWKGCQLPATHGTPPDAQSAFFESYPRMYVRFGLTDISTNPSFYSIRIMPEILSNRR